MQHNLIETLLDVKITINWIMDVDKLQGQCHFFSLPDGTVLRG